MTSNVTGDLWTIESWFYANASIGYTIESDDYLNDTRLRFRVNNIMNEDPPLADESFGYFSEHHSAQFVAEGKQ